MKFDRYLHKRYIGRNFSIFLEDKGAWIDLILSKTALIFATVVILAALYHFAADLEQLNQKEQLEVISQDMSYAIDSVGSSPYRSPSAKKDYSFDKYRGDRGFFDTMNVSVSGEYIAVSHRENNREIFSAEPLTYRTLALTPEELSSEMIQRFSAGGELNDPINLPFTYEDIFDFLAYLGTKETELNTSTEVHIAKTLIFYINDTEVRDLEYILVYQ
ncbi:hypothetical protein V7O66_07245 [Methanolobus sp. ZRKC3]|uniref:hypothetical protein n=1 Tax=Methanolobus sp. ZRKC3 TaxID=3125786 RepID=UPI003245728A